MNRWEVTFDGGSCHIYAKTAERAVALFDGESNVSVAIDENRDHEEYIERLKNLSGLREVVQTDGGSEKSLYETKYAGGSFLFILMKDLSDNTYYDYIKYQRRATGKLTVPVLWDISTPERFYRTYFERESSPECNQKDCALSTNELKKLKNKPKLFHNKDGFKFWKDEDGFFYLCEKLRYPNKRDKELFGVFGGNKNAVCALFEWPLGKSEVKWFNSEEELQEYFRMKSERIPPSVGTPTYTIRRRGFTSTPPDDRKVIYRLPYLNLDRELNENPIQRVVLVWTSMCDRALVGDGLGDAVNKLIRAYIHSK